MKTYIRIVLFVLGSFIAEAQTKCLHYQAVIINPNQLDIPGNTIPNVPFGSGNVCLKFSLLNKSSLLEYQEIQCTQTDSYGLVTVNIGLGNSSGLTSMSTRGLYGTFDSVIWDAHPKKLKVDVSFDQGKSFTEVSTQTLNYTAYALYAESVEYQNVRSAPTKLSQFTDDMQVITEEKIQGIKTEIAKNTSDIKLLSTANNQNTSQVGIINQSISEIKKLDETQNYRLDQLLTQNNQTSGVLSNLNFTYERLQNKSTASNLGATDPSDGLYPSQKAVKSYVDAQSALKEPAANKSTDSNLGSSNTLFPSQNAVKSYVDAQTAPKELLANKSTDTNLGSSNTLFPSQNAVKTYVDAQTTPSATSLVQGKILLAGDLSGTAALPRIASNAVKYANLADSTVTTSKIVDANVTDAKIVSLQAAKLTGSLGVAHGGTGVSTLTGLLRGNGTGAFSSAAYASFYDITNQTATLADSAVAMKLGNTDFASGISILNNSKMTVTNAGVYNIQFSAQVDRNAGSTIQTLKIWLRKNGIDVPASATEIIISGGISTAAMVAAWNFFQNLVTGDQVELMWSVTNTQIYLAYTPSTSVPRRPAIPSLIVTINQVY